MEQCDCQKENRLLKKKNNNNIKYLLLLLIAVGLILVFKKCN